jgi:hypothetical protein
MRLGLVLPGPLPMSSSFETAAQALGNEADRGQLQSPEFGSDNGPRSRVSPEGNLAEAREEYRTAAVPPEPYYCKGAVENG